MTQKIPYYSVRQSVKPGVTGWAQVRYHYGASDEDAAEKLQYDLYYVKNHSLFLDLVILFETVGVVLLAKGRAVKKDRLQPRRAWLAGARARRPWGAELRS